MSTAVGVVFIGVHDAQLYDNFRDRKVASMSKTLTASVETLAAIARETNTTIAGLHEQRRIGLEGKPLFQIFRGRSDMSGADFPSGPTRGLGGAAAFPGKPQKSPFDSSGDGFDATDKTSPALKRTPTIGPGPGPRLKQLTDDQKKIARLTGVSEEALAARLDTLADDEEDVVGVDGLLHPTRVKAPHCVMPNGWLAMG